MNQLPWPTELKCDELVWPGMNGGIIFDLPFTMRASDSVFVLCATALWAILANIGYTPRETHAEVALHSNGAVGVASTLRQAWVLHIAGWRSGRRKT